MCGIVGIFSAEGNVYENSNQLNKALKLLEHRGPDFQQYLILDSHVALGHTRLSVIDLSSAAHQPFFSSCNRYVLVYNGEIYNFKELKSRFLKNFSCKTHSDTEVLLELYVNYGKKILNELVGFFAFAIYDTEKKTLFIARDRWGKKPLIYHFNKRKFFFSSELNSLLCFYEKERKINKRAMGMYFMLEYIPGEESILEDIHKLKPGHCAEIFLDEFNNLRMINEEWYKLPYSTSLLTISKEEAINEIRKLVIQAVDSRLIADVPLGTFLSGGIDSSIVTGLAAKRLGKLYTYSIGFKDYSFYDESKYAQICASRFETIHKTINLKTQELFSYLPSYLDSVQEPYANSSALLLYILCKKAKEETTVILTGDGADELFGGYVKQRALYRINHPKIFEKCVVKLKKAWQYFPKSRSSKLTNFFRQLDKFARTSNLSRIERYKKLCQMADYFYLTELINDEYLLPIEAYDYESILDFNLTDHSFNQELKADMNLVLSYNMLHKLDSASMANGVELRSPFVDHRLIEFVFKLPHDYKLNRQNGKIILKETFKDLLPPEIFRRPKKGFDIPLEHWFRNELSEFCGENTNSRFQFYSGKYLKKEKINLLKKQVHSKNSGDTPNLLWAILVFNDKIKTLGLQ
jgi:asparagine synthase (glutamine-hydrolysing)